MIFQFLSRHDGRWRRRGAGLTLFAYAATLVLTACGGGGSSDSQRADGALSSSATTAAQIAAAQSAKGNRLSSEAIQARLSADAGASSGLVRIEAGAMTAGATSVSIKLPSGVSPDGLRAMLNGHDVSTRFGSGLSATLSANDGLNAVKNVMYVTVADGKGGVATGRLRFGGAATSPKANALSASALKATATGLQAAGVFIPPSVVFKTVTPGGPSPSTPAWIQIRDFALSSNCDNRYHAQVLDRQTLAPKTADTDNCFADGGSLATYLQTLDASDLVVVTTVSGYSADSALDTSAIGGTKFSSVPTDFAPAGGYMAIGVGGATPGTSYQNYGTSVDSASMSVHADGMLIEGVNGAYNFTATNQGPLEYAVTPNDPSYGNLTNVRIASIDPLTLAKSSKIYSPAPPASTTGGFWLLRLNRSDMSSFDNCASGAPVVPIGTSDTAYPGCGMFFETGSSNPTTAQAEITRLSNALGQLGNGGSIAYRNMVVLTTVGRPFASSHDMWSINLMLNAPAYVQNLVNLGAPTHALPFLTNQNSAFTLISSLDTSIEIAGKVSTTGTRPNFTQSMNGDAVVSTTAMGSDRDPTNTVMIDQGQTGAVKGVFLPDTRGYYEPSISTQAGDASGGLDLGFHEITMSSPVDWPELTTPLAPGASVQGQNGAYRYLSYLLLTQNYLPGFTGSNLDDIHYFFTGSLNTQLSLALKDPTTIPFPPGPATYQWQDPVSGALLSFTAADLAAVAAQLKAELQALSNVLTFMSTGSRNIKDIIAGGQNSAALALISAAAKIEASVIKTTPSTPATLNYADFLNFFGGVTSIATSIAGALIPGGSALSGAVALIGGITSGALWSGGSLGFSTPGTQSSSDMPNAQRSFLVDLSTLANSQMQSQMATNFDATVDLVTSDYNRLMATNSKILNDGPGGWYAARASGEAAAAVLMGKAAERSFYLTLLPAVGYWIDTWLAFAGTINTDNGGQYGDSLHPGCAPFYPKTGDMPVDSFTGFPSPGSSDQYRYDIFVLGGLVSNGGSSKFTEALPGADLSKYIIDPSGLSIPALLLFDVAGPVPMRKGYAYTGFAFGCFPSQPQATAGVPGDLQPGETRISLNAPTVLVAGGPVTLTAHTVAGGNASTAGGAVLFTDGSKTLGTATIDQNGNASLTVVLGLGAHSFDADFVESNGLRSSSADPVLATAYAAPADFSLQASNDSLAVGDATPIQLQISSQNGFAGAVKFSCTGLPEGMECQFGTESLPVDQNGASTTLKIVPASKTQAAAASTTGSSLPFSPLMASFLPLLFVRRRSSGKRRVSTLFAPAALAMAAMLSACGGGGSSSDGSGTTETKTVLVTATDGKTTHSIPVKVTVPKP